MHNVEFLENLRKDAGIYNLDTSRGKIARTEGGGYLVRFDPPLFDVSPFGADIPSEAHASTAFTAEVELLQGLRAIQRAERQKCRIGHRVGWSIADINHRPLTDAEVDEHKAVLAHEAEVARLQQQLATALAAQKKRKEADVGVADLKERYGLGKLPARKRQKQESTNHE